MIVKMHNNRDGRILLAVADTKLVGQKFEEGNIQLDLSTDFFKGEEKVSDEIGDLLRNADMITLVGEEAVRLGLDEGAIDHQAIRYCQGIPFAQGILIQDD